MKKPIYNLEGEKIEEMELSDQLFGVPMNRDLLHQVVISYQANKRRSTAHTKTRSEVSGGGRKPWPQKGTGRARHGSIRSPLWVGGGTTFGPSKHKKYEKKIPKKMRKKAFLVALSSKERDGELVVLDKIFLDKPKTKMMDRIMKGLKEKIEGFDKGSVLMALSQREENVFRAGKNIPGLKIKEVRNINALDLLSHKYLVLDKKGVEKIKQRTGGK